MPSQPVRLYQVNTHFVIICPPSHNYLTQMSSTLSQKTTATQNITKTGNNCHANSTKTLHDRPKMSLK